MSAQITAHAIDSAPAPALFTHIITFRVRYSECDSLGHVNNTHYLRYMQETAFDASAAAVIVLMGVSCAAALIPARRAAWP